MAQRRTDKDIVIKLHTGGGKTLVALLIAQSVMNELNEPVLYLAPTNQLVLQVLAKSREYGIPALPYIKKKPLPTEFFEGKCVLVGVYETLFNGRSKFGIRGSSQPSTKVGAIILDDAHVALSSVRDAFTLTIPATKHKETYAHLAGLFRVALREVGRGGTFSDITTGKDYGAIEVPSWAWHRRLSETQEYLAQRVDEIDPYIWPFLRDNLANCHCIFSRSSVSITPIFPLVDLVPTFVNCSRRIYMSATIADDSEIVRTFDASSDAIAKPITSTSLAGVGERMILVPELMKLPDEPITPLVKHVATNLANRHCGVAILTPSGATAQEWIDIAEYPETTADVSKCVAALQTGNSYGPIVLANRYDGIDLAGDACRLLVMDNLPQGSSNYDVFRMNVVGDTAVASLLAQRVEQGLGRGTRGGADYCVVLLVGSKLVGWIGRKNNLSRLTSSTRVQIKMGQEVSDAVSSRKEFIATILTCLKRDPDWVTYHASELAEAAHAAPLDPLSLRIASGERRAFRQQRLGQFKRAITTLEKLMGDPELEDDAERRAWLSALAARIAYQMEDEESGQRFQTNAYAINNNHSPPRIRLPYVARPQPGRQSANIVDRLLKYERPGSMLADFDEAVAELVPEASPGRYEESLAGLGSFLGFEAERPESVNGVGPDVLWRTDGDFDFVIEAKSQKSKGNPLYKKDHAQLLEAEHWFEQTYPGRDAIRVSALAEAIADAKATPAGTFALRLDDATRLASALRGVLAELVASSNQRDVLRSQCEDALTKAQLKPSGLKKNFLTAFGKKPKRS